MATMVTLSGHLIGNIVHISNLYLLQFEENGRGEKETNVHTPYPTNDSYTNKCRKGITQPRFIT